MSMWSNDKKSKFVFIIISPVSKGAGDMIVACRNHPPYQCSERDQ